MDSLSASAPVSYPAVMEQRYRSRLPAALVDLSGPARGTVKLPLHCELDILREVFNQPPEVTPYGRVLALYDVIGTKVRALGGRGLPRNLIDIDAASQLFRWHGTTGDRSPPHALSRCADNAHYVK